ncbi:polysaccharide deacetylase family protein [Mechercharimyces sp. CAU 1602]|uniref:golvesin C-terminal-like domain-containing protein n=1 Tax=Mechercharimyces sp. CAU 1602 TaxID=2973933 RepID=UPI002161F907|nr:polysaccharide deacetylase family protein [Mechercharimyces sp. CAU 1602]MCS1350216.1 polysaccharide deacetylase family protein [Mechercharimyces sp. CAU 1602]
MKKASICIMILALIFTCFIPTPANAEPSLPPEIITLDNSDPMHQSIGEWETRQDQSHYRFNYLESTEKQADDLLSTKPNLFIWNFSLPSSGKYRVYTYYPAKFDHSQKAPYQIYTSDGMIEKEVNQQEKGSTWVELGVYHFDDGANKIIQTAADKGSVSVDAIRLERVDGEATTKPDSDDPHNHIDYSPYLEKEKINKDTPSRAPSDDGKEPIYYNGPRNKKKVALTFDDGPHAEYTARVLDILKEEDVPATFFVLGENAKRYPHLVKRAHDEGHKIASHTWNHPQLTTLPKEKIEEQLDNTRLEVEGIIGKSMKMMRPPYGAARGIEDTIEKRGYEIINWDVDTVDWERGRTAAEILETVKNQARSGSIILQHDGGGNREATVQALPAIISYLQKEGYKLVTIDELLNIPAYDNKGDAPIIVDNSDPANTTKGTWFNSTNVPGYYSSNYQGNRAGSGEDTFNWNFNLPDDGSYRVSVRYTSASDRASNTPYTIHTTSGEITKQVNQKQNGGVWIDIGTYDFKQGLNKITQNDRADGYVIADAIRLEKVEKTPDVITLDNSDSIHDQNGKWTKSTNVSGYYNENYQWNIAGSGSHTFTWKFNLPREETYRVSVRYTQGSDRTTNAPYTIHTKDGEITKYVDQTVNGNTWVDIGTYTFKGGINQIIQTDKANDGYVIADAIRIEKTEDDPNKITLDNTDIAHQQKGNWVSSTNIPGYHKDNYQYNKKGSGLDQFTWNFDLTNAGEYRVFVHYTTAGDRATNAPYIVHTSDGPIKKLVNQKTDGSTWIDIGTYQFSNGANKIIQTDDANGYVIADSIRIEKVNN